MEHPYNVPVLSDKEKPSYEIQAKMKECINDTYILNGKLLPCTTFDPCYLSEGFVVYEVIRVIGGKYLFLEDHLARLESTIKLSGLSPGIDPAEMIRQLHRLVKANNRMDGNVKLAISYHGASFSCYKLYYITHQYPSEKDYAEGVRLASLRFVRKEPHIKIWRPDFRETVNKIISAENVWDVLLLNEEGLVSEASKANIFFIRGNVLYTPPLSTVLPGITRNYIFTICRQQHIDLHEETIYYDVLDGFNSAFITGTSPKVLPVSQIDHFRFSVPHELMTILAEEYDLLVKNHLRNVKYS